MIKTILTTVIVLAIGPLSVPAQEKPAYRIFTNTGEPATYEEMRTAATQSEVVLFGELHNSPIAHWLQHELGMDLFREKDSLLTIGAEMFEADNQLLLDEYFDGIIQERHFTAEAKIWSNYQTDYRPLLEFARANELKYIATNIPRRYAALVNRAGLEALDTLSPLAKQYMAPLPIPYDPDLPGYKSMSEMGDMPAHINENLPKAQAIKDATMAHFILENLTEGGTFLHLNGTYHSNNDEGINWYLRYYGESPLEIITISTVEQETSESVHEKNLDLADFIIVIPSTMTKTY
ncbi:MAG: ChaN family lipoprotein [Bacteroidales bacterium]